MSNDQYYLATSTKKGEIARLDVQHEIWLHLFGGQLLNVPFTNEGTIVDLGCGSAIWTAAVAGAFPNATVIGVDTTPPENDFDLRNLTLVKADIEEPWSFSFKEAGGCDVITVRVLVAAIADWPSLFRHCLHNLRPGGWIEIPDITIGTFSDSFDWQDESSPLMRWFQCFRKGASTVGIDGFASNRREEDLVRSGFVHTSGRSFRCYMSEDAVGGAEDKEVAYLTKINALSLLDAVTSTMEKRGQWDILELSNRELQQLKNDAKTDIIENAGSRKYYWEFHVHMAQKPL